MLFSLSFTILSPPPPSTNASENIISYFSTRRPDERNRDTKTAKPVFKRFTEENSPPALYNHGFENMDSVGAVYSRASSHIFGDWNAW